MSSDLMRYAPPSVSRSAPDRALGEALAGLLREGLHERGRLCLRLQGDSMWPTLPPGCLVEIERVSPEDVRVGDTVIWPRDGDLVAHRVVHRTHGGDGVLLVTKGDNASAPDQVLRPWMVIGRVVGTCGQDGLVPSRGRGEDRRAAAFWVWRWRVRNLLGRAGSLLPGRVRWPLIRFRNWLGRCLSAGYRVAFLD
jgi:signal peptidase I